MRCTRRIAAVLGLFAIVLGVGHAGGAGTDEPLGRTVALAGHAAPMIDWP
ncbi:MULTISPECIES: hypothetical protein [Streptomyces]|nr:MULTISPECIES: hypothetical protein [unclassified Streptomyces]